MSPYLPDARQSAQVSLLTFRSTWVARTRAHTCSEVCQAVDGVGWVKKLAGESQQVQPFVVGLVAERSIIKVEPVHIDANPHRRFPRNRKGRRSFRLMRPLSRQHAVSRYPPYVINLHVDINERVGEVATLVVLTATLAGVGIVRRGRMFPCVEMLIYQMLSLQPSQRVPS